MANFSQIGKTQHFEWGTLTWIIEPLNLGVERLNVGLVTFKPQAIHEDHIHSGEEQVIYVVSGSGLHTVNGEVSPLSAGVIQHIPPYTHHQVTNSRTDEDLKLIIVYAPSKFQQILSQPIPDSPLGDSNFLNHLDNESLRGVLNKLSEALDLSLAITSTDGKIVVKTDNYPSFCTMMGSHGTDSRYCQTNITRAFSKTLPAAESQLFLCCNDIASVLVPILNGNSIVGYIRCGQVFLSKTDPSKIRTSLNTLFPCNSAATEQLAASYEKIKLVPKSRLYAAAEATYAIANYITDMLSASLKQKELDYSRISLIQERMAKTELEKNLREADFKLLLSQINPHFLFNTLNTIAQLAYLDGSEKVAKLVWHLSDLLRCTLRKTDQMIPLKDELKMLESYLSLQIARFGDKLTVNIDIESSLLEHATPCMLLQPLVENAIIHGFESRKEKGTLSVIVRQEDNRLIFSVEDNGAGFDSIKPLSPTGTGLGLQSIKNRLSYYFADDYTFHISSQPGKGTLVTFSFPIRKDYQHAKN